MEVLKVLADQAFVVGTVFLFERLLEGEQFA